MHANAWIKHVETKNTHCQSCIALFGVISKVVWEMNFIVRLENVLRMKLNLITYFGEKNGIL